jgi:hypothetical protein
MPTFEVMYLCFAYCVYIYIDIYKRIYI